MYSAAAAIPSYIRERIATMSPTSNLPIYSVADDNLLPERGVLQSALQALATLMGAKTIALLSRATESGSVELMLSTAESQSYVTLVPGDEAPYVPLCEVSWLHHHGELSALVKLVQQREYSLWAAIAFDSDSARTDPDLLRRMPTYVALLASQAATLCELAEARARHHAIACAFDQQDSAIFILGVDQEVLYANRIAQSMLERRAGLQLSRARLRPLDYKDAVRFETAVHCVIDAQREGAKGRAAAMLLLLPLHDDVRRLAVTIAPASQHSLGALSKQAAAIISVEPADDRMNHAVACICEAYQLSPVEIQLVCHLAAGLSVGDAASRMRVKVDTARAYLKQVFAKTGAHRQASLLQLITRHQRVIQGNHQFAVA